MNNYNIGKVAIQLPFRKPFIAFEQNSFLLLRFL